MDLSVPAAVKKPSLWIAIISAGAALAHTLTSLGEPHLAVAGMLLSAIFKVAEASQDAWITGKKLDVEKQFVSTTGNAAPTIIAAAVEKGLGVESAKPPVTAPNDS